jgi:hypothetical protein
MAAGTAAGSGDCSVQAEKAQNEHSDQKSAEDHSIQSGLHDLSSSIEPIGGETPEMRRHLSAIGGPKKLIAGSSYDQ